jgi:hypothetical protein
MMCKKCKKNNKYWLHIADDWTEEERIEMYNYLFELGGYCR